MATVDTAKVGYTLSLFVTKTVGEVTKKVGYDNITIPGETKELARVELRGGDLEAILSDTKQHIDLIRTDERFH